MTKLSPAYSVPYGALLALGGLRDGDSPLRARVACGPHGLIHAFTQEEVSWSPGDTLSDEPDPDDRVLLPASRFAVACVLARHLFGERFDGRWALWEEDRHEQDHPCYWLQGSGVYAPNINICAHPKDPDDHAEHLHVPTLQGDPVRDLGEALVWAARRARHISLPAEHALRVKASVSDPDVADLVAVEIAAGLPRWAVETHP